MILYGKFVQLYCEISINKEVFVLSKWICSECNHSNNSHARYCLKCGHFKVGNIVKKSTVTWRCPICKVENNDHTHYCWKCGHWLLSEKYTPTKIEKGVQTSEPKPLKKSNANVNNFSILNIIELIVIIMIGCSIFIGEGSIMQSLPYILIWIFFTHLLFSVIYIVSAFFRRGFLAGGRTLLMHVAVLFVIFMVIGFTYGQSANQTHAVASSIDEIKRTAIELDYEDMLRNANGKYKNTYVKVSGKVYHLVNGNQNDVMINLSLDPYSYQAVYIKRKEQDQTLILDDNVVIYGKLSGTIGTINAIGVEASAPVIESYSLILLNE